MIYHSERPDQGRTHTQSKFEDNRITMKNDPLIQRYPSDIPGVSIAYRDSFFQCEIEAISQWIVEILNNIIWT